MDKIIKILSEIDPSIDFANETHLISGKLITSLEIMQLVAELSDAFDVEITPLDILPENFESVSAIKKMIDRLIEED
ncbi:MAG: phosphopantetheine-binding protein [Clostridia bacterium]